MPFIAPHKITNRLGLNNIRIRCRTIRRLHSRSCCQNFNAEIMLNPSCLRFCLSGRRVLVKTFRRRGLSLVRFGSLRSEIFRLRQAAILDRPRLISKGSPYGYRLSSADRAIVNLPVFPPSEDRACSLYVFEPVPPFSATRVTVSALLRAARCAASRDCQLQPTPHRASFSISFLRSRSCACRAIGAVCCLQISQ